jgi:ribonuclease E
MAVAAVDDQRQSPKKSETTATRRSKRFVKRRKKVRKVEDAKRAETKVTADTNDRVPVPTQVDVADVPKTPSAHAKAATIEKKGVSKRRRKRVTRKATSKAVGRRATVTPEKDTASGVDRKPVADTAPEPTGAKVTTQAGKPAPAKGRRTRKARRAAPGKKVTDDTGEATTAVAPVSPKKSVARPRAPSRATRRRAPRTVERKKDTAGATGAATATTIEPPQGAPPGAPADTLEKKPPPTPARPEPQPTRDQPVRDRPPSKTVEASAATKRRELRASKRADDGREATRTRRTTVSKAGDKHTAADTSTGREMLINVSAGDECRIAILHENRLEELFIERESTQSHVGNIYKGRITNVEPSIQAAFIDFGLSQNGFLHISDVQPQYFPHHKKGESEDVGRKIPRHNRPPIQKCFRRGQEVIVQVTKEGVGTKGPALTTYLSLPGRFLVMMPGMSRHGVSRKIEDEADRRSMRDMLNELDLPPKMGFILRTAGRDRTKRELQRDLNYLQRLWKTVMERIKRDPAPAELYQESDLVTRTIRDVYTTDFTRVVVDDEETGKKASEFLQIAMPRSKTTVEVYAGREPLFHRFGIEEEIEQINMRHVPLPSGGSLVIDSTEALVAIDVNSGRFRTTDDAEETAFRINIEAAEEIARQLRLRDLGGLIMCDFIDMRLDRHKREVERGLREALKKHKERARILRMSAFGIIEMTRQRQGPSLNRNIYHDCPHCKGTGIVKMPDSMILDVMRIIQLATNQEQVRKVTVTVASDVAYQILNEKRAALAETEMETGKEIVIKGDSSFTSDQVDYACEDKRGRPANVLSLHTGSAAGTR